MNIPGASPSPAFGEPRGVDGNIHTLPTGSCTIKPYSNPGVTRAAEGGSAARLAFDSGCCELVEVNEEIVESKSQNPSCE